MLTADSPLWQHLAQNLALLALSLFFLPLSTLVLLASLSLRPVFLIQEILFGLPQHVPSLSQLQQRALAHSRPALHYLQDTTREPQRLYPPRLLKDARMASTRLAKRATQSSTPSTSSARSKIILITGLSMTKALTLARFFHRAGHRVVGADTQRFPSGRFSRSISTCYVLPSPSSADGNASYISRLLYIITREKIDLWIPCSGVATEVDDGAARDVILRRTPCKVIQLGANLTAALHEKDTFIQKCQELGLGSAVPETHNVTSRDSVHRVLHASSSPRLPPPSSPLSAKISTTEPPSSPSSSPSSHKDPASSRKRKHYILKPTGVDDASRSNLTLLPRRTASLTYDHVAALQISKKQPFILQQFVPGKEYCTHALVVRGEVKTFVACESSAMLMHYTPLKEGDPVGKAMEAFTRAFAGRLQDESGQQEEITAHLSFDFLASESIDPDGGAVTWELKCIECNPRPHTAVVLLKGREEEVAAAYLSALESSDPNPSETTSSSTAEESQKLGSMNGALPSPQQEAMTKLTAASSHHSGPFTDDHDEDHTTSTHPPKSPPIIRPLPSVRSVYWLPHDLTTLLLLPLLQLVHFTLLPFLSRRNEPFPSSSSSSSRLPIHQRHPHATLLTSSFQLFQHIILFKEGTYEARDPLPAWWLWSVSLPGVFVGCLWELARGRVTGREGGGKGGGDKGGGGGWSSINVGTGKVFGV